MAVAAIAAGINGGMRLQMGHVAVSPTKSNLIYFPKLLEKKNFCPVSGNNEMATNASSDGMEFSLREHNMEGLLSAFADGEWDSTDKNFLNDDAGFMLYQLLNSEVGEGSATSSVAPAMWSSADNNTNFAEANQSFFHHMGSFCTNSYHLSPHYGSSSHKDVVMAPPSHDKYYIAESYNVPQLNNNGAPSEFCMMDVDALPVPSFTNAVAEGGHFIDGLKLGQGSIPSTQFNLKRKVQVSAFQSSQDDITSEIPKKKTRAMKHACGNRVSTTRWKTSLDGNEEEAINSSKQVSSSYSSEDDSNASAWQDFNAGTLSDSKVAGKKTRRRSGSAIDPQSLYARKRRERINERLRILQNLVPNGTKVDISTMLEEAVNYVKFLQTQIKLLSSDDLWMYAPIAYNGVDIGLDRKLSQNL